MDSNIVPDKIPNWINGEESQARTQDAFSKLSPHSGQALYDVTRSGTADIKHAVAARAQEGWSRLTPVQRGEILHTIAQAMRRHQNDIAAIVARETGMSMKAAHGETAAAIAQGEFMAGEGRRFYGRTVTSGVPNKYAMTVRQLLGLAALIIAANTPIANVAWKVFPALICGNTAVLKAAEDTPATAWYFGKIAHAAGLPAGVLNIIQGYGEEAGAPLVANSDVDVISFTGSTLVGRQIAASAGERLTKVSLELGGKNPLVICDDADLENATEWALLSAFSNTKQRCASASRILVFDAVYDQFRDMLKARTQALKLGPGDDDDLGPVINERQLSNMLVAVEAAQQRGARADRRPPVD